MASSEQLLYQPQPSGSQSGQNRQTDAGPASIAPSHLSAPAPVPVSLAMSSAVQDSAHPFPAAPPGTAFPNTQTSNAALAYANAQLAQFAATGGALPSHLDPSAVERGISAPGSGASSPGGPYRSLPRTGYSTPGAGFTPLEKPVHVNGRVAASSITGKRLNWSEMICQTIAESDDGRLVIQDLFDNMCAKFPEIREWAYGKDWEARVKNRIKSTLSIKGNLFIKVPKPSTAAGKGSWWTLSPEAQQAWQSGRVASVVKAQTGPANHNRAMSGAASQAAATGGSSSTQGGASASHSHAHGSKGHMVGSQSAGPSSRQGSPVIGRRSMSGASSGPHSASMTTLRNAIYASGIGQPPVSAGFTPAQQAMASFGLNPLTAANMHADGFSSPFAGTGSMTPTAGFLLEGLNMSALDGPPTSQAALPGMLATNAKESELAAQRLRIMENSVNEAFKNNRDTPSAPPPLPSDLAGNQSGWPSLSSNLTGSAIVDDDQASSSLSPEDATTSSTSDSDFSNPLEHTTAALLNSLGMDGGTAQFYESADIPFDSGFGGAFGGSPAALPLSSEPSPVPYQAYTPGISGVDDESPLNGASLMLGGPEALSPANSGSSDQRASSARPTHSSTLEGAMGPS